MSSTVKISELKTDGYRLAIKASEGEVVVITKAGKPIAQITPYSPPKKRRLLGCMRGLGTFDPNLDFKAIARDEIMEMFYGKDENSEDEK